MFAGPMLRGRLLAALILLLLPMLVQPATAQNEQYREREVLDPEMDDWVQKPPEQPGTAGGELEIARQQLAQGQGVKARKPLKKWVKLNAADERYLEGVFLLGEAYYEGKDYYKAYEQYEIVADNGAGDLFRKALRREIDVARAFLSGQRRLLWGIFRVPAYDDGVKILDKVYERVPGTRMGEDALRYKADFFFSRGEMDSAQDEYANLVKEYPSGRYVRMASLRSAEAAAASFAGVPYDDRPLIEAQERYRTVEATFPQYAEREKVAERLEGIRVQRAEKDLYVAKWYEKTRQRGAAEFYYRQILKDWPDTLAAAEARSRLRALGVESPEEGADK